MLYSNQFSFDRRGVPLITVAIAEGLRSVVVEGASPISLLPEGEDGPEVKAGKRWEVTLVKSTPASVKHFVVLAREPASQLTALRQQLKLWKQRGARPSLVEVGTVFGVRGKVFDNRAYLLLDGPYADPPAALRAAEGLASRHGLQKVATLEQLVQRPAGALLATAQESGAQVRVADALWFDHGGGNRLTVVRKQQGKTIRSEYWGQIYVTVDKNGTLAVVNAAPADRLLAGLVPAEIYASAPMAALKAQALAARGELLAKLGTRHLADPYLLCASVHCQVYAGASQETPNTTRAVNETRGLVLVRPDGTLVDTVYSAACGGHTEHNDNVWPTSPDATLRGHLDAPAGTPSLQPFAGGITPQNLGAWLAAPPETWCGRARFNQDKLRWTVTLSPQKVDALVAPLGVGHVRRVRVLARGVSGRIRLVEIEGDRGKAQVRGELTIRRTFGNLRSSMFLVHPAVDPAGRPVGFTFIGGGWGHGVGMCQTGAIGMAAAGKTFKEILLHYYQGSQVETLY